MNLMIIAKTWSMLDLRERHNSFLLLAVMLVNAFTAAAMVGSVFPFLAVLGNPDMIFTSKPLYWMFAKVGFDSEYHFLVFLGFGALVVIISAGVTSFLNLWAISRYSQNRVYSISRRLLAHYLAQPYEFFLNRHTGDMSTRVLAEVNQIVGGFITPFAGFLSALLTVAAILTSLLIVNPLVASISLCVFITVYGGSLLATRRIVRQMGQSRALANQLRYRVAGEVLSGIKDIKLMGKEAAYLDRYSRPSLEMARFNVQVALFSSVPGLILQTTAFSGLIILCLILIDPATITDRDALRDVLPILGMIALASQKLLPQMQAAYGAITQMSYSASAVEKVHSDLFGGLHRALNRCPPTPLGLSNELALENVCYTYPITARPSLSDVSLKITAGERVGIVGTSGAGKTTMADIILGLLTPQSGSVIVDGHALTGETIRNWQASVGYVPQDIFLTDATLSENIALGYAKHEIDIERVELCARIAQIHDFAQSELQNGYETLIGERGVRLSGGQRQRIGIARALYKDADTIVFDEATSALDNLTEREVMNAFENLPGDKTLILIAHRLSTVKSCDRIIVMEDGTIAGVGTWEELLLSNPAFRNLAA